MDTHDTSESLATGGETFNVSYEFDTQDRLEKIAYPTGLQVPITPNAYGTPASVGSYASNIGYHPNGAIETLTYGNGWAYTKSQNARQLPYDLKLTSGSTPVSHLRHLYDANANITAITDYVTPAATRSMSYDDLDRLSTASGLWGSGSYSYDALGNITSKTEGGETRTYHYDTNNRLTSITGASPVSYGTQDFDYNRAGNMVSSTNPSITYQYDGHKRRVQQTQGGQTEYTMYSQSGTLLHKQVGGVTTDYIYAGQMLIARNNSSTGLHYLHTDLLGSPIEGKAGSTGYTEHYTPWGEKLSDPIQLADDVGYTGHQSDTATGLTYMQARYYDPVVGRFMAVDPVGFTAVNPTTFNRYSYVNNNPYRFTDPTGMAANENGPKDRQDESNKRCQQDPNCFLYRSGWSSSTAESQGEQSSQPGSAESRPALNRTDIKNIATESERLFWQLSGQGVPGLIAHNPLLGNEAPNDLELAYVIAANDVGAIMIQSNSQHLGRVLMDSAPFTSIPVTSGWFSKLKSVFQNLFPPNATGPVAIPCGMNGCDLYVGEHEIEF